MTLTSWDVSIIVPSEKTNYITNPSFSLGLDGYTCASTDEGTEIVRSDAYARRGLWSCKVTPGSSSDVGVDAVGLYYEIALTSDTEYTFSVDVLDVAGIDYYISIDTSDDVPSTDITHWHGTGFWHRHSVTHTTSDSGNWHLWLYENLVSSSDIYYTDGWQLEEGKQSTFIDGEQTGFVNGQNAYRWNGTRGASTSWRSGQTRAGGTYFHLNTIGKITNISGLGMDSISNITSASTRGGSFYQNTIANERPFSIVMTVYDSADVDYGEIGAHLASLIDAIKPDATMYRQPLLLQIDQLDESGNKIAETLQIPCMYESGLEGMGDGDPYHEKIAINFKALGPTLPQEGTNAIALGYQYSTSDANCILQRAPTGSWTPLATGLDASVAAIAPAPDGTIYIGGNFTSDSGTSDLNYIGNWNGTAFSALGTGLDKRVYALAVGADASLYAGGDFTSDSGTSDLNFIGKWTPSSSDWTALGTGFDKSVYALAIDHNGDLYAGGLFTSDSGTSDLNGIGKWTQSSSDWSALGTGIDVSGLASGVYALTVGLDGTLYVGGLFDIVGSTSDYNNIASWDGLSWSKLGTGMDGGQVRGLATGPDGAIYAVGGFTSAGGDTDCQFVAKWNGSRWLPLGTGLSGTSDDFARSVIVTSNNNVYVGGTFTTAGGITLPDSVAMWNGASWVLLAVNLPGSADVWAMAFGRDGTFYLGYDTTGTAYSAVVTVPNSGDASIYPTFVFTGPGTCYQVKNVTTGKGIYFNITFLEGEVAKLILDPLHLSFTSSFRGNLMPYVLPGSNLDFELLPGANNISAYIYGNDSAPKGTGIELWWQEQYWSLAGALQ